ncbi:uncharacterized protein EV422DRAFT_92539 [Fimicolochytrium jonesii]|uniref:uncharacterized protein n=1 Tax=Fimicolochytrium jonesii TaxID=1396493 RepID=UPI0022FE2B04|nr:uncharacterized protein EV422DRAFT_92539 [Fimicolochytrium jonesii]KAI8819944.1 hypothetical protein EV422DRAFT_92539 [Fimicolochytrium jonesii]
MATATAPPSTAPPGTPLRPARATPPSSAGTRTSTSARPSSSRAKSAGKNKEVIRKTEEAEEGGRKGVWEVIQDRIGAPLTWTFLTAADITALNGFTGPEDVVSKFAQLLGLDGVHRKDLFAGISVMFHVGNYMYAKDKGFTDAETAAFCAILKTCLENGKHLTTLDKALTHTQELLIAHTGSASQSQIQSTPEAPTGEKAQWEVFRPEVVDIITDYIVLTFLQHFRLYHYTLTHPQPPHTTTHTLHLNEPPTLTPPTRTGSGSKSSRPSTRSRKSTAKPLATWPPPLSSHLPLAIHEAQKAEQAQRERERIAAEAALREEERKARENPFGVLDNESVKNVAVEVVAEMLAAVGREVEARLEEGRGRFLERVGGVK